MEALPLLPPCRAGRLVQVDGAVRLGLVMGLAQLLGRKRAWLPENGRHVAFFHPWLNVGDGRERVLWSALRALERTPQHRLYVFTGEEEPLREVAPRVWRTFGLCVPAQLEADVLVNSSELVLVLPVFRLLGCGVTCYVHQPFPTAGQLHLWETSRLTRGSCLCRLCRRLVFYAGLVFHRLFDELHRRAGASAHLVIANSTWTQRQVARAWRRPDAVRVVYPPCDTWRLGEMPLDGRRDKTIVSIAHFRPEKEHKLQLRSFALFVLKFGALAEGARLVLIGGCRGSADLELVDRLQFRLNLSFEQLSQVLARASVGIHTAGREGFGIVQYAECMRRVLAASEAARMRLRIVARERAYRFAQERFEERWLRACHGVMSPKGD
ncbi:GDP-Man:Man(3)GlcNAc(2)-PP-Dol alpha-1,2-mannosyltransferase-like [Pollicipes pollicipes]|uniref:GDP-Man:Man(3)GlcNAc(2)-PP-Dol alpha-1,2-mannosyltransferase-like n=1 Tax=Pollicipes pollicipes TaxID=41117 RepID=UPI001884BB33|nr:GDP-Man:Man(3)GlcNAc(2)-PP-Dol alpha-1,2-mannosyltransferase-like [Pollicipes pollicipes]